MPHYDAPEIIVTDEARVACVGEGGALGHPKVWYTIGAPGFVECKYCDRRFILSGSAADPGVATIAPSGHASAGIATDADGARARGEPRDIHGQDPQ